MPKITPYEIKSYSPQAVGVPQPSRAGEIIGEAVQRLGQTLQKREEASNNLAATAKYGDYKLEYETQKIALQKQYRDNPNDYPAAVKEMGSKLADQHGKKLSGGVNAKFRQITTSGNVADADNSVTWAFGRQHEIDIGNVLAVKQNIALDAQGVGSAEALKANLAEFDSASPDALKFITPEQDLTLTKSYKDLAKQNAMNSQIYAQPAQVLRDLKDGKYAGILEPDEISTYSTKALTAIHNRAEADLYRSTYIAQGELLDLQTKVDKGQISPAELIAKRQAAWIHRDEKDANDNLMISPEYIKGLDNLIAQQLHTESAVLKTKDLAFRENKKKELAGDWDDYLREKEGSVVGPRDFVQADIVKELSLYNKINEAYTDGHITESDARGLLDLMRSRLSIKTTGSAQVMSFDQALKQAGSRGPWWSPSNDVYTYGYKFIKDYINAVHSKLDPTSKQDLTMQMLAQYTQRVQNLPEDSVKNLRTDNAKQAFAKEIVMGQMQNGKPVMGMIAQFGDSKTENGVVKIFRGVDPQTGAAKWDYAPWQIATNSRGQRALVLENGQLQLL